MMGTSLIAAATAMVTMIAAADFGCYAQGDRDKTGTGGGCPPTPSPQVTNGEAPISTGSFAVQRAGLGSHPGVRPGAERRRV
jgi:hypothetical protein